MSIELTQIPPQRCAVLGLNCSVHNCPNSAVYAYTDPDAINAPFTSGAITILLCEECAIERDKDV
jgi:hypothetical protein